MEKKLAARKADKHNQAEIKMIHRKQPQLVKQIAGFWEIVTTVREIRLTS